MTEIQEMRYEEELIRFNTEYSPGALRAIASEMESQGILTVELEKDFDYDNGLEVTCYIRREETEEEAKIRLQILKRWSKEITSEDLI